MGQLIKLQDYVSRYEMDLFRYPSQYVRLKKQQWDKLEETWVSGPYHLEEAPMGVTENLAEKKSETFKRLKNLFNKDRHNQEDLFLKEEKPDEFQFSPIFSFKPDTKEDLKQLFLDQLLKFQMKWASSTIYEKSFVDQKYFRDERLKYFLQRFPDTFLFLYEPIFLLKKAPLEMDVIVISPTEVWCLTFLEEENEAVYLGSNDRFWLKRANKIEKKILNPLISLNRMGNIVKQLFGNYQIELPVKKGIICRNGYIDYPTSPFDVSLLEKREYPKWFERQRSQHSPLKHGQLKAAKILLDYCQTSCAKRQEWEDKESDHFTNGEFDV